MRLLTQQNRISSFAAAVIAAGVLLMAGGVAWAGEPGGEPAVETGGSEVTLSTLPFRYIKVDGDVEKFRAHHWKNDGYAGGIKELTFHKNFKDGVSLEAGARAIFGQNDFGGELLIKKENFGFAKLEYSQFRKWYDRTGGVYYPFKNFPSVEGMRSDLWIDIGKLEVETGLTLPGWPELEFDYEHEVKDGTKNRLTWTSVRDFNPSRKIGPSWQDVNETVDDFAIRAHKEVLGFSLKGEQRWEFVHSNGKRYEKDWASDDPTVTATNKKLRTQQTSLRTTRAQTTVGAEKWFWQEKAATTFGYRFATMKNKEFESIREFAETGEERSFGETKANANSTSDYDSHIWTGNLMVPMGPWFTAISKLKAERIEQGGASQYPDDSTPDPPDGIINRVDVSHTQNHATRVGEGASIRFTGIPRTALYAEMELEQAKVLMREVRESFAAQSAASASEIFLRRTLTDVQRDTWTVGGRADPVPWVDVTTHLRHRRNRNVYTDQDETVPTTTAAKSAFFNEMQVRTDEVALRATLKPSRVFRPSFRYQYRNDDIRTEVEREGPVNTGTISHIYTYDMTVQPCDRLLFTGSVSKQTALTFTPAAEVQSTNNIPKFHADVYTWLLGAEYTPSENLVLNTNILYSRAPNFVDFTSIGMPYGSDYDRLDVETGLQWTFRKNTSLKAEYALYRYLTNPHAEAGEYNAHLISMEVSRKF